MSSDLVSRLPSIYRNAHDITNKNSASSRGHPSNSGSQGTSGKALGWGSLISAGLLNGMCDLEQVCAAFS